MKSIYFFTLLAQLTSFCEALHLVRYYGVKEDFRKIFLNAEYPEDDPLNLENVNMRQIICDQVIIAREYIILSWNHNPSRLSTSEISFDSASINFQRLESTTAHPNPRHIRHTQRNVIIGARQTRPVKLIECVRTQNKNWFIAIGQDQRMFLIKRNIGGKRSLGLVVDGLFESEADYNMNFPGPDAQRRLYKYFSNQVEIGNSSSGSRYKVPFRMTFCTLNFKEHGRLCTTAINILSESGLEYFQGYVRHLNYNHIGARRCLTRWVKMMNGRIVMAKVTACAINQNHTAPQFYILRDSHVVDAIFIFRETSSPAYRNKNLLELVARLGKVTVLSDHENYPDIPEPEDRNVLEIFQANS